MSDRADISEEEMLIRLRKVLMKTGKLRASIIEHTVGLPSYRTLWVHFGSIRNVYRLIGYTGSPYWDRVDANNRWRELNAGNASLLREHFEKLGYQTSFDPTTESVQVEDVASPSALGWLTGHGASVKVIQRAGRFGAGWTPLKVGLSP